MLCILLQHNNNNNIVLLHASLTVKTVKMRLQSQDLLAIEKKLILYGCYTLHYPIVNLVRKVRFLHYGLQSGPVMMVKKS